MGGRSFNLPEQVALLMKQAFEALSIALNVPNMLSEDSSTKGKATVMIESIEDLSKPSMADGAESSRQGRARKEGNGKSSYCFCCKTKGHAIKECHENMFCDICESMNHVRLRCPKVRVVKSATVPCGFTVEGMRFFSHIAHESLAKQRTKACLAVVSVTVGVLSIQNVIVELQRLIP
jgi:hypothetical protein